MILQQYDGPLGDLHYHLEKVRYRFLERGGSEGSP